ncbi:hypothetical protein [Kitasatospora mediocidica]|uniref:hypothetical protein n=1 Tax=Kitasatospora mediocidica TaxID=58352 RepID=UPI00055FAF72|nr:hypothetical protein [Kitasatospora mediocidica]
MVIPAVLVLAVAGLRFGLYVQQQDSDRNRRHALAAADASARSYAAKLLPAFAAKPQTTASLTQLESGTFVHYVAVGTEGTAVVVTLEASIVYPDGWVSSPADSCFRDVISRRNGSLADQLSGIPCTALLPPGDRDTPFEAA